ncbi:MAG TPA: phage protein GemA/Gp16 family protein [Acidobacteriota bacterium]|nr:phage protein GemA/Gp16 family protein [Acidobacteriota bacterium]
MAEKPKVPLKPPTAGSEPEAPETPGGGLDRKKLALIHIVKKELGLSDPDYRCVLKRIAGVESSKDLDEAGFRKMMRFFVRSDYFRANSFGMTLKQKLFIKSLVSQLGWEDTHLKNFIHKYYQHPDLDHLNRKEASKLIESLKAIREHGARA